MIFDGKNLDMFEPAEGLQRHLTKQKTVFGDVTSKPLLENHRLHLKFHLSWMPRGCLCRFFPALGRSHQNLGGKGALR